MIRQLQSYFGVGVVATACHYAVLIGLVQLLGAAPVPSALCGYIVGGIVSYGLNRAHTFSSDRPHREAVWRFALVATVGFLLTFVFMWKLVDDGGLPYLPAQILTTLVVMAWTFSANRLWTFRAGLEGGIDRAPPPPEVP